MGDLRVGVHARIRPPGAVGSHARLAAPINPFQRIFQKALHRANRLTAGAGSLHLPAFEERPRYASLSRILTRAIMSAARAIVPAMAAVSPAATLVVTEIFRSLQGESSFAGLPCAFVRLTGCALRCVWCDSAYAFSGGETRPVDEVVAAVARLETPLVEITGGEPLEQEGFYPLSGALCDRGFTVLAETGGHVPVGRVDPRVIKVLDVKCPGSGMESRNDLRNLDLLGPRDEIKFVVAGRRDFDWAERLVKERGLDERHMVLISPVFEGRESPMAAQVAEWVRDSPRKLRLNLQIHKLLWGDVPGR